MRKHLSFLLALVLVASLASAAAGTKEAARLRNSGVVMDDILRVPDDIPSSLVDKAECVIVVPSVVKLAFVVGGSYGRGAMTCRGGEDFTGSWSAPTMIALEGGSLGFQMGGQATDFIILVMNPRGAIAILNSKVRIGVNVSAAAGPKGRSAEAATDATLRAELLTYSRSRGLETPGQRTSSARKAQKDRRARGMSRTSQRNCGALEHADDTRTLSFRNLRVSVCE